MSEGNFNFRIVVPCFNSEQWVVKNIESIYKQTYTEWKCVILNDKSTDKTLDIINKTIPVGYKDKFVVVDNEVNKGALHNIVDGISLISDNPEDIIVLVDGDDWLYDYNVLNYLKVIYKNFNPWLTYGQYSDLKRNKKGCSHKLVMTRNYRKDIWKTSHLRTFKKHLWDRIKPEDLKDSNGNYYSMSWDMAIMYPMIEMAGLGRIQFIDKLLYVYNNLNPINDDKKNHHLQLTMANEIKNKPSYKEIPI